MFEKENQKKKKKKKKLLVKNNRVSIHQISPKIKNLQKSTKIFKRKLVISPEIISDLSHLVKTIQL